MTNFFVTVCRPIKKYHLRNQRIILKGYSTQKVGNFQTSYRQATWNTNHVCATEQNRVRSSPFFTWRSFTIAMFCLKTIQMPSLGSKEALNVPFPGFPLNSFFSSSLVVCHFVDFWHITGWRQNCGRQITYRPWLAATRRSVSVNWNVFGTCLSSNFCSHSKTPQCTR